MKRRIDRLGKPGHLGSATLAFICGFCALWALICSPMPTAAQGNTLCAGTGGDYATIQAAIDAAQAGDTIRVTVGDFTENLHITKTLTLAGGWQAGCDARSADDSTSLTADTGRLVTIDPGQPGVKVVITEMMLERGDATGLGGVDTVSLDDPVAAGADARTGLAAAIDRQIMIREFGPPPPQSWGKARPARQSKPPPRIGGPGGRPRCLSEQLQQRTAGAAGTATAAGAKCATERFPGCRRGGTACHLAPTAGRAGASARAGGRVRREPPQQRPDRLTAVVGSM